MCAILQKGRASFEKGRVFCKGTRLLQNGRASFEKGRAFCKGMSVLRSMRRVGYPERRVTYPPYPKHPAYSRPGDPPSPMMPVEKFWAEYDAKEPAGKQ